jgi:hypothetical protein
MFTSDAFAATASGLASRHLAHGLKKLLDQKLMV